MSYIRTVRVSIREGNLPHLREACNDLSLIWHDSMTSYMTDEGPRPCRHAIEMKGQRHTIGVVERGEQFELQADFYGAAKLRDRVGSRFELLTQRMSVNMAREELFRNGAREIEEEVSSEDNRIRLVATY